MGFLGKLVITLASLAAFGQASPTHPSATPSLSLSTSGPTKVTSPTSPASSKVPIKLPTGENGKWYVFEMMCPQWELARGCLPGLPEGWMIRGYCLTDGDAHAWSNWHNIDGCVDISQAGNFVQHYDSGNLTSHCIDCNDGVHDTYLHPAAGGNVPTKLMCSCNATDTSDHWHTVPAAIMPGKFLIGLDHGQIWCAPTSYDQYPSVPEGSTIAKDPTIHDNPRATLSRRLVPVNNVPKSLMPVKDETTRNQTVSVGYFKTCYYITVTKSDPVLIALCRESPSIESPLLWNSLELNSCFAYRGHRIASGSGLNRDGCRDCVMNGSRLQCACSAEQNQTMQYPQFDTDKYIINDNGNLCCPGSGVCAKASASPPPALQQLQPPPEGRPAYPDGSGSYYPQGGYGQSA